MSENDEIVVAGDASVDTSGDAVPMSEQIKKQIEYYFSKENLSNDTFLQSQMDAQFSVPLSIIIKFPKVKALCQDELAIRQALEGSTVVSIVDNNRLKAIIKPVGRNTIILREIPSNAAVEEVKEIFNYEGCSSITSIRSEIGDTWFVAMDSEDDAKTTLIDMRVKKRNFRGKAVKAGLKTEMAVKSFYIEQNNPPPPVPFPMQMNMGFNAMNGMLGMPPPNMNMGMYGYLGGAMVPGGNMGGNTMPMNHPYRMMDYPSNGPTAPMVSPKGGDLAGGNGTNFTQSSEASQKSSGGDRGTFTVGEEVRAALGGVLDSVMDTDTGATNGIDSGNSTAQSTAAASDTAVVAAPSKEATSASPMTSPKRNQKSTNNSNNNNKNPKAAMPNGQNQRQKDGGKGQQANGRKPVQNGQNREGKEKREAGAQTPKQATPVLNMDSFPTLAGATPTPTTAGASFKYSFEEVMLRNVDASVDVDTNVDKEASAPKEEVAAPASSVAVPKVTPPAPIASSVPSGVTDVPKKATAVTPAPAAAAPLTMAQKLANMSVAETATKPSGNTKPTAPKVTTEDAPLAPFKAAATPVSSSTVVTTTAPATSTPPVPSSTDASAPFFSAPSSSDTLTSKETDPAASLKDEIAVKPPSDSTSNAPITNSWAARLRNSASADELTPSTVKKVSPGAPFVAKTVSSSSGSKLKQSSSGSPGTAAGVAKSTGRGDKHSNGNGRSRDGGRDRDRGERDGERRWRDRDKDRDIRRQDKKDKERAPQADTRSGDNPLSSSSSSIAQDKEAAAFKSHDKTSADPVAVPVAPAVTAAPTTWGGKASFANILKSSSRDGPSSIKVSAENDHSSASS